VIKTGRKGHDDHPGVGPDGSKFKPPDMGPGNGVRFGCGALFGAFASLGGGRYLLRHSLGTVVVTVLAGMLICGLLAVRYGEAFWEGIASRRWW